jgi:phosphohistidine phosphatase
MERRLVLMRHAKSSWSDTRSDHARGLNKRGRRDAPKVAARIEEQGWEPDMGISSDAMRTTLTWEGMGFDAPVRFTRDFYLAGLEDIREDALRWDDRLHTVLVLGHNPGWAGALAALSGEYLEMTTGNAALLLGAGPTWADALEDPWRLIELIRPREL